MHDAFYAPRKRRPRKSTLLMGKLAHSVFDLHVPEIDFTGAETGDL